ncbi:MAG: glycosyltransferase family 2 protein [Oscillospiraceae bacterium]|nr:glycosyltransferase family 2 protein [Oscillospiraceae bacterium]
MNWIIIVNTCISILFTLCYAYQFFYLIYAIFVSPKKYAPTEQTNRYAVMISARNEEKVIGHLLQSIKACDYPSELVDIYVIADNCTDATAQIAADNGATVYQRFNQKLIGKGYALNELYSHITDLHGMEYYDGFFVFDADNLLDKHYITEMDKCFSAGNRILTSYRNSKNYGDNWISAGYALWFLREAKFLNNPRSLLGTSCAISGTGFLIHRDILNQQKGWKHFLLTEDIEFSVDNVLQGEKIGYCHTAILYDEQPSSFKVAWRQRLRWSKGFLQVMRNYGLSLSKQSVRFKSFSAFDMLMTIAPAFLITIFCLIANLSALVYAFICDTAFVGTIVNSLVYTVLSAYLLLLVVGVATGISEWKQIHCSTCRKILSFFTFPLFMMTYIPISIQALFVKVEWKPIEHNVAISMDELTHEKVTPTAK